MASTTVEAFCRAVWRHEHKTVAVLAGRVDPNGKDRWGYTPLLMAARYGDSPLVSLLIQRGAEVDQGRKHLTPITYAARRKAADIVRLLRDRGATESIVTGLYLGDHKRVKKELARDPAQATLRDEEETPILHHAVEALQPAFVALLLKHGATIADVDPNGETPLHRCADIRQAPQEPAAKMVNLLLDRGADPNARDKNRGSTPLRRAVTGTGAGGTAGTDDLMAPLTRILLEYGADPDARDKRGVPVHASARAPDVCVVLNEHRQSRRSPTHRTKSATKPTSSTKRKRGV